MTSHALRPFLSRLTVWLAALAMALAACQPSGEETPAEAGVWPHEQSDIAPDPAVVYGVLENGLRYAILENDTPSGAAAVRLIVETGSLGEDEDQRGLAHFLEHMAFNGTTHVPEGEMVPLLERYGLAFGPDTNAFTSFEYTGYQLDLPSTEPEVVDAALFLMRETASEMTLSAEAIERERGVILSERRTRDTPIARFFERYRETLYPGTLIPERNPIGLPEVIETAGPEPFKRFYADFYRPDNAVLVVVGEIDAADIERRLADGFALDLPGVELDHAPAFADWTAPDEPAPVVDIGALQPEAAPDFTVFEDADVVTILAIDAISRGSPEPDTAAARRENLLKRIGGAILQRRLQRDINRGVSPLVNISVSHGLDFDIARRANMTAVTSPDRWREALAALETELRRAREYGFTQAELDEQLAEIHTALRDAAAQADTRDSARLAGAIWKAALDGEVFSHPRDALDRFEGYADGLTVEAVEAAFEAAWSAAEPQVFLAIESAPEGGEAALEDAWRNARSEPVEPPEEVVAQAFAYEDFGPAGAVASRTEIADLGATQVTFENGVVLTVKPTDFEDAVIRARADFGRGDLAPQPTPAANSILGPAFQGAGLEAHDREELERILAGRSVGYGLGVGPESYYFANTTTPEDFELQMQVWAAFMTAPAWRDDGLNQFRAVAGELRRAQNASATQVVGARVSRRLRSGDPRWGFPTEAEVEAFTMDHAREMLEAPLKRAPLEVTIVGDVTVERAVEVVAATLAALPARDETWPDYLENAEIAFPEPNAEPEIVRFNGEPGQGMANLFWKTDDASDITRARALNLLAAVYDLKATERFRERDASTYSAIVSNLESDAFPGYGYFWVGLDVDAGVVSQMYAIAHELARDIAEGRVSEDEMARARTPILERIEESLESNRYWLSALSRSHAEPERLERIRTREADYRAIDAATISELAGRYLAPGEAFKTSLYPQGAEIDAPVHDSETGGE